MMSASLEVADVFRDGEARRCRFVSIHNTTSTKSPLIFYIPFRIGLFVSIELNFFNSVVRPRFYQQDSSMQNSQIGDEGVKHFAGLVNLRKFNLDDFRVTAKSLVVLKRLKNLQSIRLQNVTATAAERLQLEAAMPKCKFIWCSDAAKPVR